MSESTHLQDASHVPVRRLGARHRHRVLSHLLALQTDDRYLRFGHIASDEQVARYVAQLKFDRDEIFGIFNRRLELVAMAHLAYHDDTTAAEFGVSVQRRARGRGWGSHLFERAMLHARNRGIDTLIIHALAENAAMLHIARRAGAKVENHGSDALARLRLPPDTLASHVEALFNRQVAEIDYGLKRQARRLDAWWQFLVDGAAPETGVPDPGVSAPPPRRDAPPAV
jgi:RimJ/RimL family protein N-acetyltransferase